MLHRRNYIVGLRKLWRTPQQVSSPPDDVSRTHIVSALRGWLSRILRQFKARNEARAKLDLELLLHAQAMKEALREAEERVRAEIALRIRAERKARREAETRLEIERVARQEAERKAAPLPGPVYRADPESIAKARREMLSRIKAEQLAVASVGNGSVQLS